MRYREWYIRPESIRDTLKKGHWIVVSIGIGNLEKMNEDHDLPMNLKNPIQGEPFDSETLYWRIYRKSDTENKLWRIEGLDIEDGGKQINPNVDRPEVKNYFAIQAFDIPENKVEEIKRTGLIFKEERGHVSRFLFSYRTNFLEMHINHGENLTIVKGPVCPPKWRNRKGIFTFPIID